MLFSSGEIRKAYQLFIGKQAISMALSFGSAVLIARQIGPGPYGAYFICTTVIEYLIQACQFGMVPFLYRESSQRFHESLDSFFGFTLLVSTVVSLLVFTGLFIFRFDQPEAVTAGKWLIFSLPLVVATISLRTSLEKELKSKEIVSSEVVAHLTFLLVGGACATIRSGILAPLMGWWVQNLILFLFFFKLTERKPKLQVNWPRQLEMLRAGAPVVGVSLVSNLDGIALTSMATSNFGVTGTGELGLVRKIISRVSFLRAPNTRLSNIVCGNHAGDNERLKQFVEKNLIANTAAFGVLFVLVAWTPNFLFEQVLGKAWGSSYILLPWLSFSAFTISSLYVLQATLIALEANRARLVLAAVGILVLVGTASVLMMRFGIVGWAMGEAMASLLWLVLPALVQKKIGYFNYMRPLLLWGVFGALILLRALA